jgi:hypothetical protein
MLGYDLVDQNPNSERGNGIQPVGRIELRLEKLNQRGPLPVCSLNARSPRALPMRLRIERRVPMPNREL